MSIHLTTYLTKAIKFHKAFSGYMKNIIKIDYILVVTVNSLDISGGLCLVCNMLTGTVDVKDTIIKYAAQPLPIIIFSFLNILHVH